MKRADIIDNYADLPVGTYMEIVRITRSELSDLDIQVKVIALLTGIPEEDVLDLPIETYKRYVAAASFLGTPCPEGRMASSYKVGGFDLVPTEMGKLTAAQYIDFQTLSPGGEAKTVELLSVFLVPRGKKYNNGYDIVEVQKAIRDNLSVRDVITIAAFFFRSYATSIVSSLTSCKRMLRRMKNPAMKADLKKQMDEAEAMLQRLTDSLTDGDGSRTSTS